MTILAWMPFVLALLAAPLLLGIVNRTKAVFAGRRGQPLLQAYFDIAKLLRKGAVYSRTTTAVFRAAPAIGLACVLMAAAIVPAAGAGAAPVAFAGDLVFFAYALGLLRFFIVVAALDTGSAFEGMGASREVHFSALAEPALLVGLATLGLATGSGSLSGIFAGMSPAEWGRLAPALVLLAMTAFLVLLVENARIPFDDPNTHLELTMIHEVMILDYSGPDLALVLYGASLKLWVLGALIVNLFVPLTGLAGWAGLGAFLGGMLLLAVLVGIVESVMARLSLLKVPNLLVGASAMAVLAFVLVMRFHP